MQETFDRQVLHVLAINEVFNRESFWKIVSRIFSLINHIPSKKIREIYFFSPIIPFIYLLIIAFKGFLSLTRKS